MAWLHDLASKWTAECSTVEEVVGKLVVEQLAMTMPTDLCIWLAERKPTTGAEAGKLADDYCQARRHVRQGIQGGSDRNSSGSGEVRKCHKCGVEGHLRKNCPVKEEAVATARPRNSFQGGERQVKCFNCRKFGHVSMHCPEKASYFAGMVGDGRWLGQG